MKNSHKESYDSPSCEVLEVKTGGVICGSPEPVGVNSTRSGYGEVIEDSWGL